MSVHLQEPVFFATDSFKKPVRPFLVSSLQPSLSSLTGVAPELAIYPLPCTQALSRLTLYRKYRTSAGNIHSGVSVKAQVILSFIGSPFLINLTMALMHTSVHNQFWDRLPGALPYSYPFHRVGDAVLLP